MKPEEIQVGKFYRNKEWPESRWIGAGKRKAWTYGSTMEFDEKYLVCTKIPEYLKDALGLIFKAPDDEEGSTDEDWEMFYLDPDQSQTGLNRGEVADLSQAVYWFIKDEDVNYGK